jgi:hypothetical protein
VLVFLAAAARAGVVAARFHLPASRIGFGSAVTRWPGARGALAWFRVPSHAPPPPERRSGSHSGPAEVEQQKPEAESAAAPATDTVPNAPTVAADDETESDEEEDLEPTAEQTLTNATASYWIHSSMKRSFTN